MVLVSFALVVAAAITLVIGLLQSGLTLIYLSIGCSVVAGLVLAIAVLRGRPDEPVSLPMAGTAPPRPAPAQTQTWESAPASAEPEREPEYARATATGWGDQVSTPAPPPPEPVSVEPSDSWVDSAPVTEEIEVSEVEVAAVGSDGDFPIENYERLRASEIIPLLSTLSREDLERVRDREATGMNRFTVMSRVDAELAAEDTSEGWDVGDDDWVDTGAGAGEVEPGDSDLLESAPVDVPPPARSRRATTRKTPAKKTVARKSSTSKAAASKGPGKVTPARKTAAKKTRAKASTAKTGAAKRAPAKKTVAKAPAAAKAATPAKKSAAKKTAPGVKKVAKKR